MKHIVIFPSAKTDYQEPGVPDRSKNKEGMTPEIVVFYLRTAAAKFKDDTFHITFRYGDPLSLGISYYKSLIKELCKKSNAKILSSIEGFTIETPLVGSKDIIYRSTDSIVNNEAGIHFDMKTVFNYHRKHKSGKMISEAEFTEVYKRYCRVNDVNGLVIIYYIYDESSEKLLSKALSMANDLGTTLEVRDVKHNQWHPDEIFIMNTGEILPNACDFVTGKYKDPNQPSVKTLDKL